VYDNNNNEAMHPVTLAAWSVSEWEMVIMKEEVT